MKILRQPIRFAILPAVLTVAAFAQSATAQSAPVPLTMQQAVEMARVKNPTLLAARQNLLSVKAQESQAGVRQNPYFAVNGTNLTEPDSNGNPYAVGVGVGRLFERGNKREWRLASARSTTVETDAQIQLIVQQTILAVRTAFTNLVIAKAAKKLADDNLADFKKEVAIGADRYKAGDLAKLDFERLDLQLAQFESDEANAEEAEEQAADQLQLLLGIEKPNTQFEVAGEVVPPPMALTKDELEQKGLDARPDLKAAIAAVDVADAGVKLAIANGTADPTIEADYNRNGTDNSVGLNFNIPIRLFDRNQGNKETAKFTAQANRFTVVAVHNQVVSDVEQAYASYVTYKVLSDRYNGHYLAESKDVLDIARFSYEHGGLALIDYLDALRDARSVASDALNAYQQTWLAIHQLGFVTASNVAP
jgi:cobalt-zinc-cadmium efflux system outer membrane protein